MFSYHLSRLTGKNYQYAMPFAMSIEPTTSCNLRCPQCPSGLRSFSRPTGMLTDTLIEAILPQVKKHVFSINFYFQGEPYLNPDFLKMVKTASLNRLYTITSTNAHYLDDERCKETIESGLDEIIISIDGVTQETYEQYRVGGKLDKVMEGASNLIRWKKKLKSRTPFVIFQFVVFKTNEHQVSGVKAMARDMGADKVQIKTAQIYDVNNHENIVPDNPKYSRYKKDQNGHWIIKNELLNQCWRMWQSCVITWDGKVVPCCFDKDAKYQLGSLKEQTFKDIWFSKPYASFRENILKGRKEIDICTNCTEGTKVWAD
jgi:radical SAM protein with 4Fe4S-binding SPASM domain